MKTRSIAIGLTAALLTALAIPGSVLAQSEDAVTEALKKVDDLTAELEQLQAQSADRADDPTYYFELGNVYSELSRRADAVASYEAALSLKPDYVEVLVNLGALLNEQGETPRAIEYLREALEVRPDDTRAHVNLGSAFYSTGNYYDAMTEFRRALELDPTSYEAYYQIAVAFADAGIYREAIRKWQKVIELAPGTDAAEAAEENIGVVETILSRRS